ncbi:MAG: glycine cleavage system protein H [Chloroflexi bacterium]|nr:glycine cleavage system protein H [Chloroflexota bacterium]MCH2304653.1 glycine cleavage system protein GcvH [SAR202 cluster bacterium]|tara:strand:+ start:3095 stop:3475 length:381 start_codon:yes stop_codon:yes gene_type:complete
MNPKELKYSKDHEWVKTEGNDSALIGITEFATDSLGDVVFIELPDIGTKITQFEKIGEIESVKAVSDIFTPISGKIIEQNNELINNPELINNSPFEDGWMFKVENINTDELDNLMNSDEYDQLIKE